jgi:hypothetical protein
MGTQIPIRARVEHIYYVHVCIGTDCSWIRSTL